MLFDACIWFISRSIWNFHDEMVIASIYKAIWALIESISYVPTIRIDPFEKGHHYLTALHPSNYSEEEEQLNL